MDIVFSHLPETEEAFVSMPEFHFKSPFQTASLFIVALCVYPKNKEICFNMIDALKGPQKLSTREKDFIRERMIGKMDYIGKAYFTGATPQNNYTPSIPYTVVVEENPYTYATEGYATVYIRTQGADSPRPVTLRKKGDEWFLWEHAGLLTGIRIPASQDPWA